MRTSVFGGTSRSRYPHKVQKPLFSVLWDGGVYDRGMQKQLDVMIRSPRSTHDSHGVGNIVALDAGRLSLRTELVDCDLYRFLAGEPGAVRSFRGEYLQQYEWARESEGRLDLMWQHDRTQ